MSETKLYIGRAIGPRLKAVLSLDELPIDLVANGLRTEHILHNLSLPTERSLFFHNIYRRMKWLEDVGINICIDFGDWYYETGDRIQSPHSRKVTT